MYNNNEGRGEKEMEENQETKNVKMDKENIQNTDTENISDASEQSKIEDDNIQKNIPPVIPNKKKKKVIILSVSSIIVILLLIFVFLGRTPDLSQATHYLSYLGDVKPINQSITLSSEDYEKCDSIKIGNYTGEVTFSSRFITSEIGYTNGLRWETKDKFSKNDLEKIKKSIMKTYSVDDVKITKENVYIWSNNGEDKYDFSGDYDFQYIMCGLNEDDKLWIEWEIKQNEDDVNQSEIACYQTLSLLSKMLKNPSSLQIHSIKSTETVKQNDELVEGLIGIKIDYSAQNSFGGYVRDDFYAIVDVSNGYNITDTELDALIAMQPPYTNIYDMSAYGYTIE